MLGSSSISNRRTSSDSHDDVSYRYVAYGTFAFHWPPARRTLRTVGLEVAEIEGDGHETQGTLIVDCRQRSCVHDRGRLRS